MLDAGDLIEFKVDLPAGPKGTRGMITSADFQTSKLTYRVDGELAIWTTTLADAVLNFEKIPRLPSSGSWFFTDPRANNNNASSNGQPTSGTAPNPPNLTAVSPHVQAALDEIDRIFKRKNNQCDCGGHKAETTHAHWCTTNNNQKES